MKYNLFQKLFLKEAYDWIRCRYETMTGLDSHGGIFDPILYKRGYTLIGEYDHAKEMEALCQQFRTLFQRGHNAKIS